MFGQEILCKWTSAPAVVAVVVVAVVVVGPLLSLFNGVTLKLDLPLPI
jgi:hypothetical protein